ncbi:hypothetical protein D9758_011452 [Tetrapyrgos nigripes]|uniref:Uncharacterized protein n=1 Tax=Tetrapyrgos nigripes TaxID=182062 RepID=A0A8H5CQD7_9AGAR|nr:hypothetical protein D9758_011452 [Tetrapyrgos nigripes]
MRDWFNDGRKGKGSYHCRQARRNRPGLAGVYNVDSHWLPLSTHPLFQSFILSQPSTLIYMATPTEKNLTARLQPQLPASNIEFILSPDRTQFIRRVSGRERMSACSTAYSCGDMHMYASVHLTFNQPVSQQELQVYARAAWMKLRYQAPWIAYRCSTLEHDPQPNSWYYSYDVIGPKSKWTPNGLKVLEAWGNQTIIFRPELFTFEEWQDEIREVYWLPGDSHFGMELHACRGVNDKNWFFHLAAPHLTTDARGLMSVSDMFYKLLAKEMQDSKKAGYVSYQNLRWGEEVSRLAPAPSALVPDVGEDIVMNPDPSTKLQFNRQPFKSQTIPSSPEVKKQTARGQTVMNKVVLSRSETQAIALACSKVKCTLTTLVNSILILADVERTLSTLYADARVQDHRSQSQSLSTLVEENWQKSEVWLLPANPVDMRHFVHPRVQALHGSTTSGGLINLMVPSYHSMDAIRKCLSFDSEGKAHRSWYENPASFWDFMVKDTQACLKFGTKQPPHAYHKSVAVAESIAPMMGTPAAESFPKPIGFISTSIGPMERLGIYRDFSLVAQQSKIGTDSEPPFLMQDIAIGGRGHNVTLTVAIVWEFNGSLVLSIVSSKKNQTAEGWAIFNQSVRGAIKQIVTRGVGKEERAVL